MMWVAAAALIVAVSIGLPTSAPSRLRRLVPFAVKRHRSHSRPRVAAALAAVVAGVIGWLAAGSAGAAVGLSAALLALTSGWLIVEHRRQRRVLRRSDEVADACQALAGLLRVGHVPTVALRLAASDSSVLAEASAAQRVGASVVAVLRRQGEHSGAGGLTELATAWEVAETTGASLTSTLDALQSRLEASRTLSRVVSAELAAPRATGRLLAALPFFGLLLGYGIGGDPASFLLSTPVGELCLVGGVVLACVGVWWIERIAVEAGG